MNDALSANIDFFFISLCINNAFYIFCGSIKNLVVHILFKTNNGISMQIITVRSYFFYENVLKTWIYQIKYSLNQIGYYGGGGGEWGKSVDQIVPAKPHAQA